MWVWTYVSTLTSTIQMCFEITHSAVGWQNVRVKCIRYSDRVGVAERWQHPTLFTHLTPLCLLNNVLPVPTHSRCRHWGQGVVWLRQHFKIVCSLKLGWGHQSLRVPPPYPCTHHCTYVLLLIWHWNYQHSISQDGDRQTDSTYDIIYHILVIPSSLCT